MKIKARIQQNFRFFKSIKFISYNLSLQTPLLILSFLIMVVCLAETKAQNTTEENLGVSASPTELRPQLGSQQGKIQGAPVNKHGGNAPKNHQDEARGESGVNVHTLMIGIGETFLIGGFDRHGEDAITFDLLYSYSASHSFDLIVDFHRSTHKYKDEQIILQGIAPGIKGKLYQFDSFSPFIEGGFGFYRPRESRSVNKVIETSESKTTFGFHLGGGVDLKLNPHFMVGILAQYHDPFDVKQDIGPKVSGAYFKLLLTFGYSFWP